MTATSKAVVGRRVMILFVCGWTRKFLQVAFVLWLMFKVNHSSLFYDESDLVV